jgi:hypothetical protein
MSFFCSASSWIEGLGNPDPNPAHRVDGERHPSNPFDSATYLTSPFWSWNHFIDILEMYSARQITREADTLDAFLGVISHIRRSRPTTQLLCGLPFFEISSKFTVIDSFEGLVTAAISWYTREDVPELPQRQSTFPSWTWAGWSGRVEFWKHTIYEARHQSFLRHAQLESSSGQVVMSSTLYKDDIQHKLDTVTLIQFEVPMVPTTSFSITDDQPESDDCSDAEGLKFKVTGRMLFRYRYPDIYTFDHLSKNVRKGIWSCFMLVNGRCTKEEEGPDVLYSRFVLVVRWEADQMSAERVGSFGIYSDPSEDADLGPFGDESWTWRRVRLI